MKTRTFLAAMTGLLCLAACRKENNQLTGKWQEVKLRAYKLSKTTGVISYDTTYQAEHFGAFDYVQFARDNTCTKSNNIPSPGSNPPNRQLIQQYSYSRTAKGYALTPTYINSGSIDLIPTMDTIVNVTGNSLVIHSVSFSANPSPDFTFVSDAYYSR